MSSCIRPLSIWAMLNCEIICIIQPMRYCLCVCVCVCIYEDSDTTWGYLLTPDTWLTGTNKKNKCITGLTLMDVSGLIKRHKVCNTKEAKMQRESISPSAQLTSLVFPLDLPPYWIVECLEISNNKVIRVTVTQWASLPSIAQFRQLRETKLRLTQRC